jgi:ankyrin repeat protein
MSFFGISSVRKFMSWAQVINADYNFNWDVYPRHATPLYYASSFGLERITSNLISEGANLNASGNRFGGTTFHTAVLRQNVQVMKILLEAGANSSKADFNSILPLHTAVSHGNLEVISILLEYGPSKEAVDDVGETPYD